MLSDMIAKNVKKLTESDSVNPLPFSFFKKYIFFISFFTGTACIIMAAPSHYDSRKPIDVLYSKIDLKSDLMTMLKNTGREDFFDQQE